MESKLSLLPIFQNRRPFIAVFNKKLSFPFARLPISSKQQWTFVESTVEDEAPFIKEDVEGKCQMV